MPSGPSWCTAAAAPGWRSGHTEVPEKLAGRGIGGTLVGAAVDEAVRAGLTIVPACPFAQAWLRKHPDVVGRAPLDWS